MSIKALAEATLARLHVSPVSCMRNAVEQAEHASRDSPPSNLPPNHPTGWRAPCSSVPRPEAGTLEQGVRRLGGNPESPFHVLAEREGWLGECPLDTIARLARRKGW